MHIVKTKQNTGLNFKAFRQAVQNLLYIMTLVRETFLVFLSTGVGFYERLVHICTVASHQFFLLFGFWYERKWPLRSELLLLFQSRSSLWCSSLLIDSDRAKANPLLHNPPYGFTIGHTHIHTKRLERPHTPLHVPAACGTLNSDRGQDIGGRAGPRAGRLCRKPCSCWKVFHIKEYGAEGGIDQPC